MTCENLVPSMNTHRLVEGGELPQVVSDHLWLHLNLREKSLNWFKLVGKVNVLKERHFDPTYCIIVPFLPRIFITGQKPFLFHGVFHHVQSHLCEDFAVVDANN